MQSLIGVWGCWSGSAAICLVVLLLSGCAWELFAKVWWHLYITAR